MSEQPPDQPLETESYLDTADRPSTNRKVIAPTVKRIRSSSNKRRRLRSAAPVIPPWTIGVGVLLAVFAGLVILFLPEQDEQLGSISSQNGDEPYFPPLPAAPSPLPSPILPVSYLNALSATPPPHVDILTAFPTPTVTPLNVVVPTPQFSLSTSLIVFVCFVGESDEICSMSADGTNRQQLTSRPGTDWYPSLAPDGQKIVFSSQRSGEFDIWTMDLNGENLEQITAHHGSNFAPDFSPDGSRIVFASTANSNGEQNIWMMDSDGTDLTQLTDSPYDDIDPSFSPDGLRVAFSSNRYGTTELYVLDLLSGVVRQMTRGINLGGRNDWSPDGEWMTFYAGEQGNKNIYVLDASCAYSPDDSCLIPPQILVGEGNSKGPSFSPDGNWISFAASEVNGDRDNEIYIVRMDGTAVYKLTDNDISDWQPRWQP